MRTRLFAIGALAWLTVLSMPAAARAFAHAWVVKEVFTNYNGTVQFIELFTSAPGELFVRDVSLHAESDTDKKSFSVPSDLSMGTTNRHLLFATAAFGSLPGSVAPDYIIPDKFFNPNAASIIIDWGGFDSITFSGSALPKNGIHSLTDSILGFGQNLTVGTNSPTNFVTNVAGSVDAAIPGDADLNGQVDVADLGILASHWQTAGTRADGDFDGSGFVDVADLGLLASNWQVGVSSESISFGEALAQVGLGAVSVPEPGAALLLMLGGAVGACARSSRMWRRVIRVALDA